ncbi:hypothetical protein T440DRAFT_291525 [Plenodomus tracheiphilus IPT5]|uniref:Uncharacterized protein n=1 Tax=Plenodomus tracheiphilus IPT5 TaxID=1408161 RepID=A0A6A7BEC6_9PLEO|nr:hypothetical protein T440DRAFT_291525 [Plenodomus tracheiphilus IPT5]
MIRPKIAARARSQAFGNIHKLIYKGLPSILGHARRFAKGRGCKTDMMRKILSRTRVSDLLQVFSEHDQGLKNIMGAVPTATSPTHSSTHVHLSSQELQTEVLRQSQWLFSDSLENGPPGEKHRANQRSSIRGREHPPSNTCSTQLSHDLPCARAYTDKVLLASGSSRLYFTRCNIRNYWMGPE